jgi:hypothetical protein
VSSKLGLCKIKLIKFVVELKFFKIKFFVWGRGEDLLLENIVVEKSVVEVPLLLLPISASLQPNFTPYSLYQNFVLFSYHPTH